MSRNQETTLLFQGRDTIDKTGTMSVLHRNGVSRIQEEEEKKGEERERGGGKRQNEVRHLPMLIFSLCSSPLSNTSFNCKNVLPTLKSSLLPEVTLSRRND